MKKLKILILIVILLIILILGIYICVKSVEKSEISHIDSQGDPGEEVSLDTTKIEEVTDASSFFSVKNCVQQYLDEMNNNNSRYFGFDENNQYSKIVDDEIINQNRYNLLSAKFIYNNNVTINNVSNFLKTFEEKVIFDALEMRYIRGEQVENYIVYGIITSLDNEYIEDIYIIVNVDREEKTFAIEPINFSDYDTIDDIKLEYDGTKIQKNDVNSYANRQMAYEDIVKEYFFTYKRIIQARPQIIYNYLQEDYKLQRFETLENFERYVETNRDEIAKLQIQEYLVNNYEQYTEFVCHDQYQNVYIFDETNPMEFDIKLDSYTILSDKFKETYDSSNEEHKVAMNIEKWIQMLNNRDYTHVYQVLDETFRNNNWGSEEAFELYMRENFPLHYDVEYTTYSNEGSTYVQQINLSDITGETEGIISLNVIMQLKDNYEFVMSFSMQE